MMTSLTEKPLSRRDFLKGSGVLVVGFSVPLSFGGVARAAGGSAQAIGPASIDDELIDSWIVIKENGRVTIQVGKVELGTSLRTAQMQIAADELLGAVGDPAEHSVEIERRGERLGDAREDLGLPPPALAVLVQA